MEQLRFELTGYSELVVKVKIKEYLEKYPSAGYGTYINSPVYVPERRLWIAFGTRSSSCD